MPRRIRQKRIKLRVYKAKRRKLILRSGLEELVARQLDKASIKFKYEALKIKYVKPSKPSTYCPDFLLPNNIIVETKGRLTSADRLKHILVKEQNPDLDIRFVFSNANNKIYKGSPTTYADWATKHGFKYSEKIIPKEWLKE